MSKSPVNLLVGAIEILLGIGRAILKFRTKALVGTFLLMLAFLPIHIWDAFKENSAIGSKNIALVRIAIQFVLIYLPWFARKTEG